ncbi:RNA polymerase subunit sigma [Wukongibacter baidiensis]|uniref:RNA polymerase subunit sigma n=1 Tax=Wukongibacter baidiensis TaxID=1723361 RepID=UPI003D7FA3FE
MTVKIDKPEEIIEYIRAHPEEEKICKDRVIEAHVPFIVHTIAQVTGRYVEVENSEELSIGLMAFDEAMSKYHAGRGATFLSFARLVITSRIKDMINKERYSNKEFSLEQMTEAYGDRIGMINSDSENEVALEIKIWESIIRKFGFDLEMLVDEVPKHVDTRNNAIDLSEKISEDNEIVDHMYEKYKLPMSKIILRFKTTKKIFKRSKKFIIATVVILTKNLVLLKHWIYSDRKRCSS